MLCSVLLAVLRLPPDHLLGIKSLQMKIHILELRYKFFTVMSVSVLSTALSRFSIPNAFNLSFFSKQSSICPIGPTVATLLQHIPHLT